MNSTCACWRYHTDLQFANKKNLAYLADRYAAETSGSVKVVIGIKLDYGGTLKAELSLCQRPQYAEESRTKYLLSKQETSSEIFRRENGTAVRGKSLAFQVKDFIPPALAQNANDIQREIVMLYSKLAENLNKAEERLISSQRIPELLRPGAIKREREQDLLLLPSISLPAHGATMIERLSVNQRT